MTVRALIPTVLLGRQPPVGSGVAIVDVSTVGGATVAASPWELVDVTANVRSIHVERGAADPFTRLRAGAATVVLGNTAGAHIVAIEPTPGAIRPGAPIVIGAALNGVGVGESVFVGTVRTFDTARPLSHTDETLMLAAADDLTRLADINMLAGAAVGLGDTTGQRIGRILDLLDPTPPPAARQLEAGTVTMSSTQFAQSLASHAENAASCEAGRLFVDRRGVWQFHQRDHTPPLVLAVGDRPTDEHRFTDARVRHSADHVRNVITLARPEGTAQTATNATSIANLQARVTWQRFDLGLRYDADVLDLAEHLAGLWSQAVIVGPLILNAARDTVAQWLPVVELGTRLDVCRTLAAGPLEIATIVERVVHDWQAGSPWLTTLDLSTVGAAPPAPP